MWSGSSFQQVPSMMGRGSVVRSLSVCLVLSGCAQQQCAQAVFVFHVSLSHRPHGQAGKRICLFSGMRKGRSRGWKKHTRSTPRPGRATVLASGESPPKGLPPGGACAGGGGAGAGITLAQGVQVPAASRVHPACSASDGRELNYSNQLLWRFQKEGTHCLHCSLGGHGGDPLCHLSPL